MSKYDQLAFSSRPLFYLASPTTTDQSSTGLYSLSDNTMSASGQPIIYGHDTSFVVNSTQGVTIDANAAFYNGSTIELVVYAEKPDQETEILVANNGNAIFMSEQGIGARLNFESNGNPSSSVAFVKIRDWHKKLHIILNIGINQAVLTVNNGSDVILLDGDLDVSATETVIGGAFSGGYYFLLDGLGFYTSKIANKSSSLDDPGSGHSVYTQLVYEGSSTVFSTYESVDRIQFSLSDFVYDWINETSVISYHLPPVVSTDFYIALRTNDDSVTVKYDLNGITVDEFVKSKVLAFTSNFNVLTFSVPKECPSDFIISIETITSASIFSQTPAFLTATGRPEFPSIFEESIVNCPEGVKMKDASFSGVWLADNETASMPKSIEIVFKPKESGIIFTSSDGEISTSAQSGYTLWLNGISVANLSTLRIGQWNHLIITKSGTTAGTFTLNTDEKDIDYMILASYPIVLNSDQVEELYNVIIGADRLTAEEVPVGVAEGAFEDGQAVSLYSPVWSIVGSGGN